MRNLLSKLAAPAALAFALATAAPAVQAAQASDAWITTKVKMSLLTSEGLATVTDIDVDTTDGRVTLHGAVGSAEEKARAEQVAKATEGVREVRNLLKVDAAKTARETAAVSDDTLRQRVDQALEADPALRESGVEVESVENGVVVLGGEARSLSVARRALEDVRAVDGVRRVENRIESPEQLSDTETWREEGYDQAAYARSAARDAWITSATKMRLIANEGTPAFDINVDTRDAVVTLFGTVDSQEARSQAEAEARKVEGVREVRNELQVVPASEAESVARTDEQLHDAIERRLEDSPRLGEADIDVAVENGVARLTGSVPSGSDRVSALALARKTQGVRKVIDDLRVDPPAVAARRDVERSERARDEAGERMRESME